MERDRLPAAEPLAAETRRRLGPPPALPSWPLVSIVVLNRNGAGLLRRLLAGLKEHTDYAPLELILVDNASTDDSLDFIRGVEAPFPISILANAHNESFSDGCNQGAAVASGELLLFLNNDTEAFERGWLRELVASLRADGVGMAGPTLVRPAEGSTWGYRVQRRAIRLLDDSGVLGPDRSSFGDEPFGEGFGEDATSPVPVGPCILIERELFAQIDGFTHGYVYGGEDIDLALKVLAQGKRVVCSGRSVLIHRLGSTRTRADAERQRAAVRGNRRQLLERWGPLLRREYELDRLAGGGSWAVPGQQAAPGAPSREEALALGFCLKSSEAATTGSGEDPLEILRGELARRGHRCAVLRGEEVDALASLSYDVAVHLRGPSRYIPKPAQLNVLWAVSHFAALTAIECSRYDLLLTADAGLATRVRDAGATEVVRLAGEADAAEMIDAVLARATQLDFRTRVRG